MAVFESSTISIRPATLATAAVADCDGSADFCQDSYDVNVVVAYQVNAAGNSGLAQFDNAASH